MKKILFITLILFVSYSMYAQELDADDYVIITQENEAYPGFQAKTYRGLFSVGHGQFKMFNYGGTPGNITALGANETLGSFVFNGYDGSSNVISAVIQAQTITDSRDPRINFLLSNGVGSQRPNRMTIIGSTGYMGVGTTDPTERLDVAGRIRMRVGAAAGYVATSDANGRMSWTDPAVLSPWTAAGGNLYRTTGNIGIGTTTPTTSVHIEGVGTKLLVGAANGALSKLTVNAEVGLDIARFRSDGATQMLINLEGNVGMGTQTPSEKLDIVGNIRMRTGAAAGYIAVSDAIGKMTWTAPASVSLPLITDADGDTRIEVEANADEDIIRLGVSGAEKMNITSSISTLNTNLVVNATGSEMARFSAASGSKWISLYQGATRKGLLWSTGEDLVLRGEGTAGKMRFQTEGTDRMTLNADGVGIGTTAPDAALHVAGDGNKLLVGSSNGTLAKLTVNAETGLNIARFRSNNGTKMLLTAAGDLELNGNLAVGTDLLYVDNTTDLIGVHNTAPAHDIHIKQTAGSSASGPSGLALEYGNSTAKWKIYHSSSYLSFANEGVRLAYINNSTGAYVETSDATLKKNVEEMPSVLDKVMELKPVTYQYKSDKVGRTTIGLIAQETQPLFPEMVHQGEDGKLGISYAMSGVIAIKALQEQQTVIEEQAKEIEELQGQKTRIDELEAANIEKQEQINELLLKFEQFEEALGSCCVNNNQEPREGAMTNVELNGNTDQPTLEQNAPNPFNVQTEIRYYIPSSASKAEMIITDSRGSMLKTINLSETGFGTVFVKAGELAPGTYAYTLFVDGNKVTTKQMVLVR